MGRVPICEVKPNRIFDVLDRVFLGLALRVTPLERRAVGKIAVPISLDHHLKQELRHWPIPVTASDMPRGFCPSRATSIRGGNTGVNGRALVHRIITEHGGTIAFDRQLHHGTRCTLAFPLHGDPG